MLCVGLYMVQDKFLFAPDTLHEDYQFRAGEELEIKVENGLYLNCLKFSNAPSKGAILYLHGNRGSNRRCTRQAEMFSRNGYDIFMPDYRGYGKSDGQIESQEQLYQDIQVVYDYIKERYEESSIIVIGYSLGSAMATAITAENNPQHLVMVAPFVSIPYLKNIKFPLVPDFLIRYPLDNRHSLASVRCAIGLLHGTRDDITLYSSSEILSQVHPDRTEFITLEGTEHRGAIFHPKLSAYVRSICK